MIFTLKVLCAALIIAYASWLAGKRPVLAGFIIALPLASMLGILFAYLEHRNMDRINEFAVSILVAVPLSLMFFLPFVLNRWLKWGFLLSYLGGILCLTAAYSLHQFLMRR